MYKADAQTIPETKRRLLDAATSLMLRQGFTATTVDQVCAQAHLTKGSFFHYFKSKDDLGLAALDHFFSGQREMMSRAAFQQIRDPLERFHGMLEFFAEQARDPAFPKACLLGNLTQELAATHPRICCCCAESFEQWVGQVEGLLSAAKSSRRPVVDFDPASVAGMVLSLLQGSILLAKARQDVGVILENIRHCQAYVDSLFGRKRGSK